MTDEAASREALMQSCIAEAAQNAVTGGGPFAALIVENGRTVARGENRVTSLNDPTAHAEIQAIRTAGSALQRFDLSGCELFTSCEPCPMCMAAIYWARIDRVYFAATRFDAAAAGFDDSRLYEELELPLMERSLPLVQLATANLLAPFETWSKNPGRVPY